MKNKKTEIQESIQSKVYINWEEGLYKLCYNIN